MKRWVELPIYSAVWRGTREEEKGFVNDDTADLLLHDDWRRTEQFRHRSPDKCADRRPPVQTTRRGGGCGTNQNWWDRRNGDDLLVVVTGSCFIIAHDDDDHDDIATTAIFSSVCRHRPFRGCGMFHHHGIDGRRDESTLYWAVVVVHRFLGSPILTMVTMRSTVVPLMMRMMILLFVSF
jgi:hypothetical protein